MEGPRCADGHPCARYNIIFRVGLSQLQYYYNNSRSPPTLQQPDNFKHILCFLRATMRRGMLTRQSGYFPVATGIHEPSGFIVEISTELITFEQFVLNNNYNNNNNRE